MIMSPRQTAATSVYGRFLESSSRTQAILVMGTRPFHVVAYAAILCCDQPYTETPRSLAHRSTAQSHGYFNGAGGRSAYLRNGGVSRGDIQMKRNLVVLAAAC